MQVTGQYAEGTYTGNGTAQSVSCGFKPRIVFIYNETDGDSFAVKFQGQADGVSLSIGAATAAVGSNGISVSAAGFSVGSDASCNENAKTFRYLAF